MQPVVPEIAHHFTDGAYAKQMFLAKGFEACSHKHNYSHFGILAGGHVVVTVEGESKEYIGHACIEILAGLEHKITALEDSHWYCIHATDVTDADIIDQVLIMQREN